MTKRQRCDGPAWWPLLRDDVVSNGGFVHPDLRFLEDTRTLSVSQNVAKGEVVLRISSKNFMTKDRAVSMCQPWLKDILAADDTSVRWTNSTPDLAIAVAMASCSSHDSYLYLHSLPESSSFDALPRRWSDEDIENLLKGTSVLKHVVSAKAGASEDYRLLLERYRSFQTGANQTESTQPFPSFEKFSDMLAAVTSRAFQIGTTDEDIAIVPILDLGNHSRGKSETKLGSKNVSYEYDASKDAMIVKAADDIDSAESVRLTYGAKANAQLLLNYGFCIQDNVEPDGSSNDILEFRALSSSVGDSGKNSRDNSGDKSITLRAGPKSYSYGGFVAALEEYFSPEKSTSIENGEENGVPNDFEDFLNECENEEEEEDDFMDLYEGNKPKSESATEDNSTEKDEIEALQRFKLDLIKMSKSYNECKRIHALNEIAHHHGTASSKFCAEVFSMSELRTIYFFVRAIDKVLLLLHAQVKEHKKSEYPTLEGVTNRVDLSMIDKQTDELAKAFMSIRHGIF